MTISDSATETPTRRTREDTASVWMLRGRPLWILSGQAGIVILFLFGFKAIPDIKPNVFILLLFMVVAGMIAFSPTGRIDRTVIYLAPIVVVTWMFLSVLWTYNEFGWRREAELVVPSVLAAITLFGMLPIDAAYRGLVVACETVVAWTVVYTVLNPGIAMSHPDGTPGWTGGFGHKNGLAPVMVLAILVILNLETNRRRRIGFVTVALAFVVLSQSTTMLAIGLIMLPFGLLVAWTVRLDPAGRATVYAVALNVVVTATLLLTIVIEIVLASRGKDLTFSRRTEIWEGVWTAIESEFWFGYGMGGVWIDQSAQPTASIVRPLGFTVFHSHNGYLEVWLQFGLIGLALVLSLIFLLLRAGIRLLRREPSRALVAMLVVVLVSLASLSEVVFLGNWMALLCGLYVLTQRQLARSMLTGGGPVVTSSSATR